MRLVFCGTPEFAVPTLRRLLIEPDFRIETVLTQPDRPRDRGLEAATSPVKAAALASGIPVLQPQTVRTPEIAAQLEDLAPDAVVILAYGQIIPPKLLAIPRFGWINLHGSLLPKYRGGAPIAWAIAHGETQTGLTTIRIDTGMDTGPILLQQEIEIQEDETAAALSTRMAEAGAPLVAATLRGLESGTIVPRPQDNTQATFAPLLKREDGRIDWELTARQIYNRIRAFTPWPGAWTKFRGHRCLVWGRPAPPSASSVESQSMPPGTIVAGRDGCEAACGGGTCLGIELIQLEGRKRVSAAEFLIGARLAPGERFGA